MSIAKRPRDSLSLPSEEESIDIEYAVMKNEGIEQISNFSLGFTQKGNNFMERIEELSFMSGNKDNESVDDFLKEAIRQRDEFKA